MEEVFPALNGFQTFGDTASSRLQILRISSLADRLLLFQSDAALEHHVRGAGYSVLPTTPKVWAAIVFNAVLPDLDYSIRMNASEVVPTDVSSTDNRLVGSDFTHISGYAFNTPSFGDKLAEQTPANPISALKMPGFLSLQLTVHRFAVNRSVRCLTRYGATMPSSSCLPLSWICCSPG